MARSRVTRKPAGDQGGHRERAVATRPLVAPHATSNVPAVREPVAAENVAFRQARDEATTLQLRARSGASTADDQEKVGAQQAQIDGFWAQRLDRASRLGPRIGQLTVSGFRPGKAAQRSRLALGVSVPLLIHRSLENDFDAVEADKNNTKDPLLKSILECLHPWPVRRL